MKWIEWAQKIQAIAQNGLTYAQNQFDIERYQQLQQIAAEIISEHTNHDHKQVLNFITSQSGYCTPKIDVRAVIVKNDKLLLVKEKSDGGWTLPGGWADIHLSAAENVEKEVQEESGFKVQATRLLAVYDRKKHSHFPPEPNYVYKMFFLCEILGGKAQASVETSDIGFFELRSLPNLSVARVTENQLHRMFELIKTSETDFD